MKPIPFLAIDVATLLDQYSQRGIGRYTCEITKRFLAKALAGEVKITLIGFEDLEKNLGAIGLSQEEEAEISVLGNFSFHSLGSLQLSRPLSNIMTYYTKLVPLVKELKPDLYFAPHYDRSIPSHIVPTIAVVHDFTMFVLNTFSAKGMLINFLKGLYYRLMWRKVKKAKVVFTCSNYSYQDLVKRGGLKPEQVKVAYLGLSDVFLKFPGTDPKAPLKYLAKYNLRPKEYFIYDGGYEPNKNTGQLLEVFALLVKHLPDVKLVVTGREFALDASEKMIAVCERSAKFVQTAEKLDIQHKIVPTGHVTDEELAALASQALAYINLSLYEGFGFGALQAMAAGTPAIVSDRASFPEISGPGALVVSLNDSKQIAAQIIELLSSDERTNALKTKAKEYIKSFNWDKTFAQVWAEVTR
jgi:glycosyltransferase involved in cell wall biosynthesis